MILNHDFTPQTQELIDKARTPGVWYKIYPAAEGYMTDKRIYYADVRYAMKRCEVLAVEKHMVPGLKRYWVAGRDTDRRMLHMVIIIGDYYLIEIEKLMLA